jgi:hypothetical protein
VETARSTARRRSSSIRRARRGGLHLRDEEGFNFLSDISADRLPRLGRAGVSGYIGTARAAT